MKRFLLNIFLVLWFLATPVLLYFTYELFFLVTVNTQCARLDFHHFPYKQHLHRKEVEKVLRGFRKVENPEYEQLDSITKIYIDDNREKKKTIHVVGYNKYLCFRCFEVLYAPDGTALEILGPFD